MRTQYDFAKMKRMKNPYAARLKQPITIRIDALTISYFKELAAEVGMPYQNLINLYLRDCAQSRKKILMKWAA
jgi:predicted DNA binding CopG/RHH family protein